MTIDQNSQPTPPRYIRIPQSVLNWGSPKTLADAVNLAEDLGKLSTLVYGYEEESPPVVVWGSALFSVLEDGKLAMLKHKLDTSD